MQAIGMVPLSPSRKWRAVTVATVVLVPAFWLGPAGLAIVPFAFVALAFLSEHPSAPGAVVRAMGVSVVVGVVVATFDIATGLVAGAGAGAVVALRADAGHSRRARAVAVAVAAAYTLAVAIVAGGVALLAAPAFPFAAVGVADHLVERRALPSARA